MKNPDISELLHHITHSVDAMCPTGGETKVELHPKGRVHNFIRLSFTGNQDTLPARCVGGNPGCNVRQHCSRQVEIIDPSQTWRIGKVFIDTVFFRNRRPLGDMGLMVDEQDSSKFVRSLWPMDLYHRLRRWLQGRPQTY